MSIAWKSVCRSILLVGGVLVLALILAQPGTVQAAEFAHESSMSSSNFHILNPQHAGFGGIASSSSTSFILKATIGDLAIGSSSFGSFGLRSGFLYFPEVIAPVLNSATAGNAQVALSWTAASAYSGWSISGYNRCYKTTGSYTCEDVGNVTSSTKTGLTNGTTYTFKIEAKDFFGNVIAESNELSATPSGPPPPGGGGGGGTLPSSPRVIFKGRAYPYSTVSILRNGELAATTQANSVALFNTEINAPAGDQTFNIFTFDVNGRRSITLTFTATLVDGQTKVFDEIFVPPSIDVSPVQLAKGDMFSVFGQTVPDSEVSIHISTAPETIQKVIAAADGTYVTRFNSATIPEGNYEAKSTAFIEGDISTFSQVIVLSIGNVPRCSFSADLNFDCRVNIVDFSILLFWWNTTQERGLDVADINNDGRVGIQDFSIMLFQWTG